MNPLVNSHWSSVSISFRVSWQRSRATCAFSFRADTSFKNAKSASSKAIEYVSSTLWVGHVCTISVPLVAWLIENATIDSSGCFLALCISGWKSVFLFLALALHKWTRIGCIGRETSGTLCRKQQFSAFISFAFVRRSWWFSPLIDVKVAERERERESRFFHQITRLLLHLNKVMH